MVASDRWLNTREASAYTGYDTKTITRAASSGELEAHRIGQRRGPWKFQVQHLDEWLTRGSRKPRRSNRTEARLAADRSRSAA